jgi:hypothetical protein
MEVFQGHFVGERASLSDEAEAEKRRDSVMSEPSQIEVRRAAPIPRGLHGPRIE